MAEVNLSSGTEASGGLADLTKKQKEMAFARSPMNNQAINLSSMEQKGGIVPGAKAPVTQQEQQGVGALAAQTKTVSGQDSPQMAGLRANLGTFATKLEATINQYLQGGPTSTINAQVAQGTSPIYNALTGRWEAPEIEVTGKLTGVLGEKLGQKAAVEAAAVPFREKTFEKVLQKFADTDGNGVLDQNEQAFLSQSFGIVNALRRLEALDPYSPEAEALKMQLQFQDREGLVSGLQTAKEKYESVSGMKIAGPEGEDKSLENLLNMSSAEVMTELEKATEGATGLFSGDVSTSLKSQFDEAARQYTGAAQEDAAVMQGIRDTTESWLKEYEDSLEASRGEINEMFLGAAQGIVADLEAKKAAAAIAGEDTKWIDQAKQWFADLQTGVQNGSKNFANVIQQLLSSDVGMAPEAKEALKKWLGQTVGEETQQKGELANLLQQVSDKGYALTKDEFGNTKRVLFTSTDKQQIAGILEDDNLNATQKNDAIQAIIEDRSGSLGKDLKKDSEYVANLIKDGNLTTAMSSFREAMVNSMSSFKDSAVKEVYNKIIESGVDPATLGGKGFEDTIAQRTATQKTAIETAANTAAAQIKTVKDTATRDLGEIQSLLKKFDGIYQKGSDNIRAAVTSAIDSNIPTYSTAIASLLSQSGQQLSPGELYDRAKVYSFLTYMRSARGTPIYTLMTKQFGPGFEAVVNTPRIVFKSTREDMDSFELAKQMSIQIPYDKIFLTTEAAMQLANKNIELMSKLQEANKVTKAATSAEVNLQTSLTKALTDLGAIASSSPLQMFMAAKTGDTSLLGKKYSGLTVEDFAKMGYDVSYIEDATQSIDANLGYTPVEVKAGEMAAALAPLAPAAKKEVAGINQTVRDNISKEKPPRPGAKLKTYEVPSAYSANVIRVTIPADENINTYLNRIGATEFVDTSRISEVSFGTKVKEAIQDLSPDWVNDFLGKLGVDPSKSKTGLTYVPILKTWGDLTPAEKAAIEPEFRPTPAETPAEAAERDEDAAAEAAAERENNRREGTGGRGASGGEATGGRDKSTGGGGRRSNA